mmetsp:Transcript_30782/g.49797  ORF Transcript_30782/g.49797 Transcript_30782/m.49797 type:complete len:373 (-) Transcript_30782:206-1324(-)|eukprot:CAMPEP_0184359654 /NCGR_PEP_ID=MMETSP1089-20130417/121011_1 /TAXON_ID=38269 ORGANISM="Gloeochaete wittrockiana, Strain SAG46.84" /NCGR_SAMPLE_ID=MMETSP1089 /ASSEMBLY_ACC=CAM_ASM_000445 /LENGTH=372 /DNA_ID=CAMNT_0026698525 /DNA_START=93 /DNA_END=1211 /DNA_ORIENTATION=+
MRTSARISPQQKTDTSHSDEPSFPPKKQNRDVFCRYLIYSVSDIDAAKQTFCCDFHFSAQWEDSIVTKAVDLDLPGAWNPGIFLVNAVDVKDLSEVESSLSVPSPGVVMFKRHYRALLSCPMDLHDFPFDRQCLEIIVSSHKTFSPEEKEPQILKVQSSKAEDVGDTCPASATAASFIDTNPNLRFCPHATTAGTLRSSAEWAAASEWTCFEAQYRVCPTDPKHSGSGGVYSEFHINITCKRKPEYVLWNLLVVALMIIMSWFSFSTDPASLSDRLNLTITLFLATVTFRLLLAQQLPKLSYLTRADQFVTLSFILLFIQGVESLAVFHVQKRGGGDLASAIDMWSSVCFPLLYALASALIFFATIRHQRHL